jgi:hypothetical protein
MFCAAAVCCGGLLFATGAKASPISLFAEMDQETPSSFTLDFGEFGGRTSSYVQMTDVELQVDADVESARFVYYYSEVEPLTLPGGISTGDLTIVMVEGSSAGTYNRLTGEFTTSEIYAIYFTGDLSPYGLESPVYLPSESSGIVTFDADLGGHISRHCIGSGQMVNPFDPLTLINFAYTCSLNALFAPEAKALVDLVLTSEVEKLDLAVDVEGDLLDRLEDAKAALDAGNQRLASMLFVVFKNTVDAYAGDEIAQDDAVYLNEIADAIRSMVRPGAFRR